MQSSDLEKVLSQSVEKMVSSMEAFPWEDRKAYADLMAQTFWYSRHTTRILTFAGITYGFEDDDHHYRFLKHASEEKKHEQLALRDIKELGFSIEDFEESFNTMALYQTQYYWIDREGPSSIYGYILALEDYAVKACSKMADMCSDFHGSKTSHFWKEHYEADPAHVESALKFVRKLSPETLELVSKNLKQTAHNYSSIYDEITEKTKSLGSKAA